METDCHAGGDRHRPCPRLLVAEDDVLLGELLAEALDADYELSHARTALGAGVLLAAGGLDGFVVGWGLLEGAEALLRCADRSGVPVLVIGGDPTAAADLARRGRPTLVMPFDADELRGALADLLRSPAPI